MKLHSFLKDKILSIVLLLFGIITIEIFLLAYPYGYFIKIYIPITILGIYFIGLLVEYFKKRKYYQDIHQILQALDEKYFIAEMIKPPDFVEGTILKEFIEEVNTSMIEHVNQYKYLQEDYKEYIEMWIHEIKIPIATSKMIIENNKNEATKSIDEELHKIENYIEQALYYARSNAVAKDYYIKKHALKDIVNDCIKKNKTVLIGEKIIIQMHDLDYDVHTDSKWIIFIINQIIQNSIKYRKKGQPSEIEFYGKKGKENIILCIKDNGMGIKQSEISRVFEKGFTGTNGRMLNQKSTGIGLYLCQKLCHKLGIAIELQSIQDEGTEIKLIFPNSSYIEMP